LLDHIVFTPRLGISVTLFRLACSSPISGKVAWSQPATISVAAHLDDRDTQARLVRAQESDLVHLNAGVGNVWFRYPGTPDESEMDHIVRRLEVVPMQLGRSVGSAMANGLPWRGDVSASSAASNFSCNRRNAESAISQ
jgi:hypothetical protein